MEIEGNHADFQPVWVGRTLRYCVSLAFIFFFFLLAHSLLLLFVINYLDNRFCLANY